MTDPAPRILVADDLLSKGVYTYLQRLRERLYEASGGPPPRLWVAHCPDLQRASAVTVAEQRVVGLDLAAPPHHVLCEVLLAELRPITDPLIRRDSPDADETWLAAAAEASLEAFLTARAPELLHDLERWRTGRG